MSRAPKRPNHSLKAAAALGLFLAAYVTVCAVLLFNFPREF